MLRDLWRYWKLSLLRNKMVSKRLKLNQATFELLRHAEAINPPESPDNTIYQ